MVGLFKARFSGEIPMLQYNIVDYIIIGILFFSSLVGLSRGLIREIFSILTWVASLVIASLFASKLAFAFTQSSSVQSALNTVNSQGLNANTQISWLALGICFIILFAICMMIGSIFTSILSRAIEGPGISLINRLLGAVFGFGRGLLMNLLLIFLMQLIPIVQQQSWWNNSQLVEAFQPAVQKLGTMIEPQLKVLKDKMGSALDDVNSVIKNAGTTLQNLQKP